VRRGGKKRTRISGKNELLVCSSGVKTGWGLKNEQEKVGDNSLLLGMGELTKSG